MKIILLSLFLALASAVMLSSCRRHSDHNLASSFVLAVEPDAKCDDYLSDAGDVHASSTVCRLPNKAVVYCSISTAQGPKCETIGGPAAPAGAAPAQPTAANPTPPTPPTPPNSPAPSPAPASGPAPGQPLESPHP